MKYSEIFKDVDILEKTRRMEAIDKMNKLWNRKNACVNEADRKVFEQKIRRLVHSEASWLREYAWFLY